MSEATTAIRVSGLHKQFGRGKRQVKAVQNLDLVVKAGQVYGTDGTQITIYVSQSGDIPVMA